MSNPEHPKHHNSDDCGGIRDAQPSDVGAIVELHREHLPGVAFVPKEVLLRKYHELFFESPFADSTNPPLVYHDGAGQVVAVLGVLTRTFTLNQHDLRASLLTRVVAAPQAATAVSGPWLQQPAPALVHTALTRTAADLHFSDGANSKGAHLWRRFKGSFGEPYGYNWWITLRPRQLAHQNALKRCQGKRALLRPAVQLTAPLWRKLDERSSGQARNAIEQKRKLEVRSLSGTALAETLDAIYDRATLRLNDSPQALQWLLDYLANYPSRGQAHACVVQATNGRPVGFFTYYQRAQGAFEVTGFGARPDCYTDVLRQLLEHAWQRGALALKGQCSAWELNNLAQAQPILRPKTHLLHALAQDPNLLGQIEHGRAAITGLEGERWI